MTQDEADKIVSALPKTLTAPQRKKIMKVMDEMVEEMASTEPATEEKSPSKNAYANIRQSLKKCVSPARQTPLDESTLDATRKSELTKGFKLRTEGESMRADNARRKRYGQG
jgi:hypothetical protein